MAARSALRKPSTDHVELRPSQYMNQEYRKLWDLPHISRDFAYSTQEFAFNKLHDVNNSRAASQSRVGWCGKITRFARFLIHVFSLAASKAD